MHSLIKGKRQIFNLKKKTQKIGNGSQLSRKQILVTVLKKPLS